MNPVPIPAASPSRGWTCPFCALLCDGLASPLAQAPGCPRAQAALALHDRTQIEASIDGRRVALDEALDAAASRLAHWQQPLFGGLGTDIAGARALYRLAARCTAIVDHADGAALAHGLRALQDRGQYIATLAEVRSRAECIVFVGTPAVDRYPEFLRRIGLGEAGSPCRRVVFLGAAVPPQLTGVAVEAIAGSGDLHADLQQLGALVGRRTVRAADPALAALAEALHASPYAVLVWEAGRLDAQGALCVEALNRIVGMLNHRTRAATFALGGNDGGHSVNQTFTWLSGLPLRTRVAAAALQHEPQLYDAQRLLDRGAVDGVLWVSSFDPGRLPPATDRPCVVFGPPAMAPRLRRDDLVFLAVATPGLNADGHLFRTDGPVVLPLHAQRDDALPGVATVAAALVERLEARR